jgi:VIT1/CCC1 family predicted Fe2+/Mn2+ transporter
MKTGIGCALAVFWVLWIIMVYVVMPPKDLANTAIMFVFSGLIIVLAYFFYTGLWTLIASWIKSRSKRDEP